MQTEKLDFINNRYTIDSDGHIFDNAKKCYVKYFERNGGLTVKLKNRYGKWKTFKPARLVAEMFVSNPLNEKHVAYKDGNIYNIKASNLVWCSSAKELASHYLTPDERKELRIAIHDAIDADNWALAEYLGHELDSMEDTGVRHQPSKFTQLELNERVPVQMGTILEVTDLKGNHVAYGSTKEITEKFCIPAPTLYKRYTNNEVGKERLRFTIIALVPKTMVNAIIEVWYNGKVINESSYTNICMQYDIHFEDLADLLYTNDNDKIMYNGLEFKMKQGQKKIPTDYSKGLIQ